ncbi:MAG: hypothetical protein AB7N70_37005 [Dehalococcoidia bacterium]
MSTSLPDDLAARVRRLPLLDQERALADVRALEHAAAHGPLVAVAGSIPQEDLSRMSAAIEADCERIDAAD